jgi:hypothetical protein
VTKGERCVRGACTAHRSRETLYSAPPPRRKAPSPSTPMPTFRPFRLLRVLLLVAPPTGAAVACAASEALDPTTEDGGTSDDATLPITTACPANIVSGATCAAPEGTTCAADACGYGYFVCAKRVWVAFRGGASFRCPATPPAEGEACSCVPKDAQCTYGCRPALDGGTDGGDAGAGNGAQAAVCLFGAWRLGPASCGDAGGTP